VLTDWIKCARRNEHALLSRIFTLGLAYHS